MPPGRKPTKRAAKSAGARRPVKPSLKNTKSQPDKLILEAKIISGKSKKRPIEQYDHKDKKRGNNPPVGLVDVASDKETGKKTYQYDPYVDVPYLLRHFCRRLG